MRRVANRAALRALGVSLGVFLALLVFHAPILTAVGRWMSVSDPVRRSDYIYLLNGDEHVRPFHAAELYHRGVAPQILIAQAETVPAHDLWFYPTATKLALSVLKHEGVPSAAVRILGHPGGITSTRDEATALRRFLERNPARRVTVVTTAYHSRRARWTLRRELRGLPTEIRLAPAEDPRFGPTDWWRSETGLIIHLEEILKWAHSAVS